MGLINPPDPIRTKAQMYDAMEQGLLGNTFRVWPSADALFRSDFGLHPGELLGVRCVGQSGLPYFHHLTRGQALERVLAMAALGIKTKIYEASQDQFITLQGELEMTHLGLVGKLSRAQTHMRAAFEAEQLHSAGIETWDLLRRVGQLGEADLDDFRALFELYPDHVIEFTAYEIEVGQLRGRRHVIWEVRTY